MSFGSGRTGEGDIFADAGYPFYRRLFSDDSDFVGEMEQKLAQARMPDPVELYLSRSITIGFLVGGVLWFLGVVLGYVLFVLGVVEVGTLLGMPVQSEAVLSFINTVKIPLLVIITGIAFGSFGFGAGFGTMVMIPYFKVSERKREINMLLPDAVSFMYALSVGGLNQLEIIESMAVADDTYGEVAREFRSIVQETKYFDTDYRTAIRQQSMATPSEELSQFLTDLLSIINSGGDMESFLDDKKDKHMRTAKQQQEMTLETLELFGEMYMTLSLFPLLLIIVLVIMSMLGEADTLMLYGTVYGLIPITGAGFLVMISTVKQDEIGDGYLSFGGDSERTQESSVNPLSVRVVKSVGSSAKIFSQIKQKEFLHQLTELLKAPHLFFRDQPVFSLGLSVPLMIIVLIVAFMQGAVPTSWGGFVERPVWATFVWIYLPLYVTFIPLMVFYEWNVRSRRSVIGGLSDNLRKLSSANDTGLTLLDSIQTVAATSSGTISREFNVIYTKVQYGMSLKEALIEFNNKYHIPRLARTVKLISKAQEASSQITDVLTTAAQASENQDDIDRERKSRTRMQVVIILMTYFTLLAVMAILKTQFLDVMAGLGGQSGGGGGGGAPGGGSFGAGIDANVLSLLFFHAVTIQAILSGFISGYIRDANLLSGVKFVVILSTIALVTWVVVG